MLWDLLLVLAKVIWILVVLSLVEAWDAWRRES